MKYRIEIDRQALKNLKALPKPVIARIGKKIDGLKHNPYPAGAVKLTGQNNIWRIRVGDYRIAYAVFKNKLVIWVVHIGDRKDFYEYFKRVKFRS